MNHWQLINILILISFSVVGSNFTQPFKARQNPDFAFLDISTSLLFEPMYAKYIILLKGEFNINVSMSKNIPIPEEVN